MDWVSYFAIFFVVWWLVLFATLPFSLKTQDEEGEVTLGTPASAPRTACRAGLCPYHAGNDADRRPM